MMHYKIREARIHGRRSGSSKVGNFPVRFTPCSSLSIDAAPLYRPPSKQSKVVNLILRPVWYADSDRLKLRARQAGKQTSYTGTVGGRLERNAHWPVSLPYIICGSPKISVLHGHKLSA